MRTAARSPQSPQVLGVTFAVGSVDGATYRPQCHYQPRSQRSLPHTVGTLAIHQPPHKDSCTRLFQTHTAAAPSSIESLPESRHSPTTRTRHLPLPRTPPRISDMKCPGRLFSPCRTSASGPVKTKQTGHVTGGWRRSNALANITPLCCRWVADPCARAADRSTIDALYPSVHGKTAGACDGAGTGLVDHS